MSSNRNWYINYIYHPTDRFAGLSVGLAALVKGELTEGEQILWMEQPSFSGYAREGIWWLAYYPVVGSIVVFFSQFVAYGNLDHLNIGAFLPYFIIPVIILPLSFLLVSVMIKKMVYAVTNRRAIVFNNWSSGKGKIKSYYLQHQIRKTNFRAKKRKNGSGNFYFTQERTPIPINTVPVGFVGIKTVDRVQEILESYLASVSENALDELPAALQKAVRSELRENENLLWIGQSGTYSTQQKSEKQRRARIAGTMAVAIFLGLGFVALTSLSINNTFHFPIFFGLVAPFIFSIGLMVFVLLSMRRNQNKYQKALKTAYLLTNQRMIKIATNDHEQEKLETYEFSSHNDTTRVKKVGHRNKTANVYLMQAENGQDLKSKLGFEDVVEADKVTRLIEQQLTTTVSI